MAVLPRRYVDTYYFINLVSSKNLLYFTPLPQILLQLFNTFVELKKNIQEQNILCYTRKSIRPVVQSAEPVLGPGVCCEMSETWTLQ